MQATNNTIDHVLQKELWKNETIKSIINSTISEYDIKGAHLIAIKILYGNELYTTLSSMEKLDRNIYIGKMMNKDKSLIKKLQDLLFLFKKTFIEENDITLNNIIETTKDSIVLAQKIPNKTIITVKGADIEFRDKEGSYSSFYRLGNKSLFYDSMTGNIRIKGINNTTVRDSPFINLYYKNLLNSLETNISMGSLGCMKILKELRKKYIESTNINIYRSLLNKNKFVYEILGEVIESDSEVPKGNLVKIINYKEFIMPLMRSII